MADLPGTEQPLLEQFFAQDIPPMLPAVLIANSGSLVAEQRFLMQAWDSVTNQQYDWLVASPDWTGALYPGPNDPVNIALAKVVFLCV